MKTLSNALSVVLLLVAVVRLPAAEAPPGDRTAVSSRIAEVTVYADRAAVTRVGTVALVPGPGQYAFAKLPGWIDESSVRASITPPEAGELLDVQVVRTFLARPEDAELRQAETALQEITDQVGALEDERAALEAQTQQLEAIRAFSLDKAPKDAAVREVKVEEYTAMVKFVGDSHLQIAKSRRDLERRQRDLQPELSVRQRRLEELQQRCQLEQRTVVVTANSPAAGEATVTLTYMLPGATWEPVHELRTTAGSAEVSLMSFGAVTQTTGEDWTGVTLHLSTQRPMETIRIPELETLLVGGGPALGRALRRGAASFESSAGQYAQQLDLWNGLVNPADLREEFARNVKQQQDLQQKAIEAFQSLQLERGTTVHFSGTGAQTLRTDGRQVRVPIGRAQLAVQPRVVAAPEVSLNAARVADLRNAGQWPLLPGRVLLYTEGAFLGTTDIDFVAPGESFPVFLGVAGQVKLGRVLDRKSSALSWGGKRTRMQVCFLITVENLAEAPVLVELSDRVPVSETEEVKVSNVRLSPSAKPDAKGIVKWDLALASRQKQDVRLEYVLDYPADLPLRTAAPSEQAGQAGQAAALPAAAAKLQADIQLLEKAMK